jgi:hypothetical protein
MLTGASFCMHFRSLNVCHFRMVEATGLKIIIHWHDLHTEFYENLLIGSKVNSGDTDGLRAW